MFEIHSFNHYGILASEIIDNWKNKLTLGFF